jgi:hypothetical protein
MFITEEFDAHGAAADVAYAKEAADEEFDEMVAAANERREYVEENDCSTEGLE